METLVANALTALISNLKEVSPDLANILDQAKAGEIDEATAMRWLMETVQGDKDLAAKLNNMAMVSLAPLRDEDVPQQMFVPRGGHGQPRLNPLFEAALVERAQFDGDIPELRTGDIAAGTLPAVPVKTTARNPVAIGAMVNKAAAQVQKDLTARTAARRQLAEAVAAGDPNALAVIQQHGALVASSMTDAIVQGTAADDPAGYRRGQAPQLMAVQRPRGSTLAKMSDAERHEMAWRFLSTTQGRRSAVDTIRDLVVIQLGNKGLAGRRSYLQCTGGTGTTPGVQGMVAGPGWARRHATRLRLGGRGCKVVVERAVEGTG